PVRRFAIGARAPARATCQCGGAVTGRALAERGRNVVGGEICQQDTYNSATLEDAKQGAISACNRRYPGHTCKIVDPPDRQPPSPEEAAKVKAPDPEKPITP